MVDKNDLFINKAKHPDKTPEQKSSVKENGKLSDLKASTVSPRVKRENFKAFQEKLKVSDVVKSVLGEFYDCDLCGETTLVHRSS